LFCSGTPLGEFCPRAEYGGIDIMARNLLVSPNAGHKEYAGWITATTVTTSGRYTLPSITSWSAFPQVLKILRTWSMTAWTTRVDSTLGYYVIEYNPPSGLIFNLMPDLVPLSDAKVLRESSWGTLLLDMTPNVGGYGLQAGGNYYDATLSMSISIVSTSASEAIVDIAFGVPPPPIPVSYNCGSNYTCIDPGNGTGQYATLVQCQAACQPPPPDTTPPVVNIISPRDGDILPTKGSPNVLISVTAEDANLATVVILIDGRQIATGVLTYNWNTKKVSSGNHLISVVATDKANNIATKTITVRK